MHGEERRYKFCPSTSRGTCAARQARRQRLFLDMWLDAYAPRPDARPPTPADAGERGASAALRGARGRPPFALDPAERNCASTASLASWSSRGRAPVRGRRLPRRGPCLEPAATDPSRDAPRLLNQRELPSSTHDIPGGGDIAPSSSARQINPSSSSPRAIEARYRGLLRGQSTPLSAERASVRAAGR